MLVTVACAACNTAHVLVGKKLLAKRSAERGNGALAPSSIIHTYVVKVQTLIECNRNVLV